MLMEDKEILEMYEGWRRQGMNEKQRRLYLAGLSFQLGRGGVKRLVEVLHVDPKTLTRGRKEYHECPPTHPELTKAGTPRIRKPGGGRRPMEKIYQEQGINLEQEVLARVGDVAGNPVEDIRWKSRSLSHIQESLEKVGIMVSRPVIGRILAANRYSLQKNRKLLACGPIPEWRDEQFKIINENREYYMSLPHAAVVSVDSLRKVALGPFANNGREWAKMGKPVEVFDHDFRTTTVTPHAIYDMETNVCHMVLGTSRDTPRFAVMCLQRYICAKRLEDPQLDKILILCDGGGSNSSRSNIWKLGLQVLADTYTIEIIVCHYPPYCSKYNPVEHRVFPHVVGNMRAEPLIDLETLKNRIENTTTTTGLRVLCDVDEAVYQTGESVSNEVLKAELNIWRHPELGQVNYAILPKGRTFSGGQKTA